VLLMSKEVFLQRLLFAWCCYVWWVFQDGWLTLETFASLQEGNSSYFEFGSVYKRIVARLNGG